MYSDLQPTDLTPERIAHAMSQLLGRDIRLAAPGYGAAGLPGASYGIQSFSATSLVEVLNCSATRGVWRVEAAVVGKYDEVRPQTVVYKELQDRGPGPEMWQGDLRRGHPFYWGIEAEAQYLLQHLRGPLRAPASIPENIGRGKLGIWFEDLGDAIPGLKWTPSRYLLAVHHLGQMQGDFATDATKHAKLRTSRVLARNWLSEFLRRAEPGVNAAFGNEAIWRRSYVQNALGRNALGESQALWAQRHAMVSILGRLPHTLCHQDFWLGQMFSAPDPHGFDETIVIDWAFAGPEAVGTDAATLVFGSAFEHALLPGADFDKFWAKAKDAYLEGLRAGGWSGDETLVELGMVAGTVARWGWVIPGMVKASENASTWAEWQKPWRTPAPEEGFAERALHFEFLKHLVGRAFQLQKESGLSEQTAEADRGGLAQDSPA